MSWSNTNKSRGSALVLVIGVGTIILLLVFGWTAFSVHQASAGLRWEDELRARYAAESVISKAVYALMAAQTGVPFVDTIKISSDSIREQTITYTDSARACSSSATIEPKGPYLKIKAQGQARRSQCKVEALFGKELSSEYHCALILSTQERLRIDKGAVRGDIRAPAPPYSSFEGRYQPGIAPPYLDPKPFTDVMGRLDQRVKEPLPSDKVIAGSTAFSHAKPLPLEPGGAVFVDGQVLLDNPIVSPEMVIRGPGTLVTTGDIQISGNTRIENIEILTNGRVKCFNQVKLRNVTICSRATIYFDDQVTFRGNLYARESIVLMNQAAALSPTLAFAQGQPAAGGSAPSTAFVLGQEARFAGVLVSTNSQASSSIAKASLFTGVLFLQGPLSLEGTVHGCVIASKLKNEFAPGANMLWNGTIVRSLLPQNFVLPVALSPRGGEYKLMTWNEVRK